LLVLSLAQELALVPVLVEQLDRVLVPVLVEQLDRVLVPVLVEQLELEPEENCCEEHSTRLRSHD
jgi:hypothetical protein